MQIRDISIDGFGIFHNHTVEGLPPGLTLFEGRNEAGKSTLMSFIRSVLFGFESRKSGQNRYEPLRGGRHGGALTLLSEEGDSYRVERYEGGAHGRIKISDAEGHGFDDTLLQRLLHSTSKVLYQNVFAFGLTELQRLETLQADEVSHHIYTAGMGTGAVPFAQIMANLEEEQGQLFKPGGKKPAINLLLSRLDQTQRNIGELQAIPEEYYSVTDQIASVGKEILELQGRLEQATHRIDRLETALRARPDWERLVAVQRELGDLLRLSTFPEGGVERLEHLDGALASLETRRQDCLRAIRDLEERRAKFHADPLLLKHQDLILALAEDREHFRKLLEHLPTLQAKVAARRKALDDILARLGPRWDDARLAVFDASIPMRERVRTFRDQLAVAKGDWADGSKRVEEVARVKRAKEAELDRLQRSLENLASLENAARAPVEEREKALRQWTQHCHRRDLLSQHQRDTKQLRTSILEQTRTHAKQVGAMQRKTGFPLGASIITVGLLFVLCAGLAVHFGQGLLAAGLVVAGIVVSGLLLWWRDRRNNARQAKLDELRHHYRSLLARGDDLERETEAIERDLNSVSEKMSSTSRLATGDELHSPEDAEEALRALGAERRLVERRKDLEGRIQDEEEVLVRLLEEHHTVEQTLCAKEQAYVEVKEAWVSLLKTLKLDEGLTPEGTLEVLATVEGAKLQLREWQESTRTLDQGEEEVRLMAQQINDALAHCGWTSVSLPDATATLMTLRKSLGESLQAHHDSERLTDQLADRQSELQAIEAERERLVEQQEGLLAAADARDGDDFRRRAASYKRQVDLERQERQLEVALDVHAGAQDRRKDLEQLLASRTRAQLERELAEAKTGEHEQLREGLARKLEEKGRLEQRLQGLEQNQRLSDVLLEHHTLVAQLEQQVQRWAVRGITHYLLDKARQVYERERQPAVLKQASEFFRVMTRGRYRRVIVPIGETKLEVEAKGARTKGTERLSRGTAEQLYLAMRLALVREYAKHAGPLPLVIDDILVNFDPDRARAAIEVLTDIANTHQVFFFTCHPHVSQWFKECLPEISTHALN